MKALVLAAGKGTRLGAAAGGLPKPLTDVGGTTPLEHSLRWLSLYGVRQVWINTHAHTELVRARVGRSAWGVPVSYSEEPQLLGTAGAWKKLESEWDATSLVIYGDNFMQFDLAALLALHRDTGARATIGVYDPARHMHTGEGGGRVRMQGSWITSFVEGGAEGMINAGAYALEPSLAGELSDGFLDFGHDVLPLLAARGELAGYVLEEGAYCMGVDTPERLTEARRILAQATQEVSA